MSFVFLPLDLPPPPSCIADHIYSSDLERFSYWDRRRNCRILPVRTPGGCPGQEGTDAMDHSFENMDWVKDITSEPLKSYIEQSVAPWMQPLGNVAFILSEPGSFLHPHIDSSPEKAELGRPFYKFRYVFSKKTDNLWFQNNASGRKVFIPQVAQPYLIDGSLWHGTDPLPERKLTLCLGTPWEGQSNKNFERLLLRSRDKYRHLAIPSLEETVG